MADGGRETIGDETLENWKELGSGAFGYVYKANHKDWQFEVAIKLLLHGMEQEAGYMEAVAHHFVPRVYGMYRGIPPVPKLGSIERQGIVMELMEGGSLLSLQKALSGPPPWALAFRLAHEVALAMNFIHSKKSPVVHSDLKPGNVLLDANLNAKIADFGLSTVSTSVLNITKKGDEGGTPAYTPPEAFEQQNYHLVRSYDIYSYGILLWTILTGMEPYPAGVNHQVLTFRIIQGDRPDLHKIDQSKADGLDELVDLMKRCWDKDPTERPTFRGCIEVTGRVFSKHKKGIKAAVNETLTKLDSVNRQEGVRPPGHATTKATEDRPPTKPVPQTDTPVPLTDKPVPQRDTHVPQTDTPVPQTDTPVPLTDKPVPQTDTPVPLTDKPVPQTDTHVPQTDTPVPQTYKPVPQTDTHIPQTDTSVPQTDTPGPQTDKPVPQTDTHVPQTDTPVPLTDKPVPQTDKPVPQTYTPVPLTDKPVPQADTQVPKTDTHVPQTDTPVPLTDKPVPQTDTHVPQTDTPVPQTDTPVPQTDTHVPQTDTPGPQTDKPVPQTDSHVPQTDTSVPQTDTSVPQTDLSGPQTDKPVPQTDTHVPQTDTPVPLTDKPVPQTDKPVPQTDTPVPQTDKSGPQTDTPVPQTDTPVPQADKPGPRTYSPSTTGRGSTDPATTALLHHTAATSPIVEGFVGLLGWLHQGLTTFVPPANKQGPRRTRVPNFSNLTLNTYTAHSDLSLSENNRKVTQRRTGPRPHLYHPDRFDASTQVLCTEGLTGYCYWEVERNGTVCIAVTYGGISRKGGGDDCLLGYNDKSWGLYCDDNSYTVNHNNKWTNILVRPSGSNRVAVYLDCPLGKLSFYDVRSDSMTRLFTFHNTFSEPLYAGFWLNPSPFSSVRLCEQR